jgi:hypothetical protein
VFRLSVPRAVAPTLTCWEYYIAHPHRPLGRSCPSESSPAPIRTGPLTAQPKISIRRSKFFINEGGLKKLQNYYFPPRPTHRLSQPNRPITSMQIMQPATQVHVPFQNPTQHTPSKVYRSLVPPCVLQPKLQKKKRKKKDKLPPRRKIETNKLTPQTPLFACREA